MEMTSGGGMTAIIVAALGTVGVLGSAFFVGWFANRKAKADAAAAKTAADVAAKQDAQEAGFTQSFELTKYIREQVREGVKEETQDLRDKVQTLERLVESLHGKYTLIRDWARDYIRAVIAKHGPEGAPAIERRIRDLLEDNGEDTITGQMLSQLRESIRNEDETPGMPGDERDNT